jgi:hypothetical protein
MANAIDAGAESVYPVRLEVVRPEKQSRLTNFPLFIGLLIRSILLIPQMIILYFLQLVAGILYLIATFGILFSGNYPRGLFNFVEGVQRWGNNVGGYLLSLYDKYPPFTWDPVEPPYPLSFNAAYPPTSSRLLNFPFFGLLIRELLLIPHFIVLFFIFLAAIVVVFIAKFAILFKAAFPEGMHGFVWGALRWGARLNAYLYGLTDKYPPFSLK